MKETIAFYKRQLYEHESVVAISRLGNLQHPEAIEALFEIAQSGKISDISFQTLLPELIKTGDPRSADIVIDYLQSRQTIYYLLLFYLELLEESRLVPELARFIDEIISGRQTQNIVNTRVLIEVYARIARNAVIPLLIQIMLDFPFESDVRILPEKTFGIIALDALKIIDSEEAREIAQSWQERLDKHLEYHLKRGSLINHTKIFGTHDDTLLLMRPVVIDYLLEKIYRLPVEQQLNIIDAISHNLPILNSYHPDLYHKVMTFFIEYAQKTLHHRVRHIIVRHFTEYDAGQSIPLALKVLEDEDLQTYAVKILCEQKYREVAPRIYKILRYMNGKEEIPSVFYDYLAMLGTAKAEKMLLDIAVHTDKSEDLAKIYCAFGKMAKQSETAFNILNRIIEDMPLEDQKLAIVALSISGKPAIGILISLLYADDEQVKFAAIEALAQPLFTDAVPHIMQLLLDDSIKVASLVLKTLEKIGTESAFATINAWESNKHD